MAVSMLRPLASGLPYGIGRTHYGLEDAMLELALLVSISLVAALDFLGVGSEAHGPNCLRHE